MSAISMLKFNAKSLGRIKIIVPAIALILCLLLPSEMRRRGWVPVIGWGEHLVNGYCLDNLKKAQSAYLVTVALDSAISLARSAGTSATIFGVGAEVTPGEILSPALDTIKTLSGFYYNAILALMVERQGMGVTTWLCFKIAMPIAMLCLIVCAFVRRGSQLLRRAGLWLCKCAIFIWLFPVIAAGIAICADKIYFAASYEQYSSGVKAEVGDIFGIPRTEAEKTELASLASLAWERLSGAKSKSAGEKIKAIIANFKGLSINTDNISGLLLIMLAQTAILVFAIPAFILLLMAGLWLIICGKSSTYNNS